MKIANNTPLDGAPRINMPEIYGIPTNKTFFYRIPVSGLQPITINIANLPKWISFDGKIISGFVSNDITFEITITAQNALGKNTKTVTIRTGTDLMGLTPMLGFTTWNAYGEYVSETNVKEVAESLVSLGLADLGYSYVNTDSGWQYKYGGEYDAILPNNKFENIKDTIKYIHSLGLKFGIYSTPMKMAWGCPPGLDSIPGCTRGKPDILFSNMMGGIGLEHMESNNVQQWSDWEIDYLKYDWVPTIPVLAEKMKKELEKIPREIMMCVTVKARHEYGEYWSKRISAWRNNDDALPNWENIKERLNTVKEWDKYVCAGHFYDLDMLEIGSMCMNEYRKNPSAKYLTEDEELFSYTMRAFFSSPIQLSCLLHELSDFEFNLITNEEVIAVNQSQFLKYPELLSDNSGVVVYQKLMFDKSNVYAVFNTNDSVVVGCIPLDANYNIRDLWKRENIGFSNQIHYSIDPHSVLLVRTSK